MKVKTDIHASQGAPVDVEQLTALVKDLNCQVPPLEMLGLANKYCKNLDPQKVSQIMKLVGANSGPAGLLSLFGG